MLHIKDARQIIETGKDISLSHFAKNGEIIHLEECYCTSSHFRNNTINVKIKPSKQVRTIRMVSVFEVNDVEVFV